MDASLPTGGKAGWELRSWEFGVDPQTEAASKYPKNVIDRGLH